jgi:PAS domain S-box-containing protein
MVADAGKPSATIDAAERVAATFRHLVENSPFGIYVVDGDFRLVQVSAGAQKVFSNVRPLLGRDFAEILRILWPEPFASEAIALFRHTLATGEPYRAPSTVERRHDIGEVESYDWKIERIVLPDGRYGVVCHFYDLSERQRYEAALEEADRRKDEFLGMLAHELRNPLSAISNAVQLLRRSAAPDADTAWARDLIERQVAHLTRMVDDLLDVSRVTQGRLTMKKEPIAATAPVRLAVDITRAQFEMRGQVLDVRLPEEAIGLCCDVARTAQAIANLLHNASKFSPEHARVELSVAREDGAMTLRVRDGGVGMAAELVPRVFDVFVQGEQGLDRRHGGLGLGLTIARRLVEAQGGTLEAASDGPGLGSEFTLRLPAQDARADVVAAPPAPAPPSRRRILIVDDNADSLEPLERILGLMGHDVRCALDGRSALDIAERFHPELAVLDIGLPGMDGYEVARRMRGLPGLESTVLVALTGYGQHEDRERARAAGFDHHLLKPAMPEAVLALAERRQ